MLNLIIFDWKRTLYNPENKTLNVGCLELLMWLQEKNIPLILIGKGNKTMYEEVERLGISNFFSKILFQEGEKNEDIFKEYISHTEPEKTYIIGDRVRSEIAIGNKLHATTIWVKQGKFASEIPSKKIQKPTHIVYSLIELREFLQGSKV